MYTAGPTSGPRVQRNLEPRWCNCHLHQYLRIPISYEDITMTARQFASIYRNDYVQTIWQYVSQPSWENYIECLYRQTTPFKRQRDWSDYPGNTVIVTSTSMNERKDRNRWEKKQYHLLIIPALKQVNEHLWLEILLIFQEQCVSFNKTIFM